MLSFDPTQTAPADFYQYLIGSVAPRPIAFVSTRSKAGVSNLAPYSFFNAISGQPPLLAISVASRSSANPLKDTFTNIQETNELVVNMVNFDIAHQMSLTSIPFELGVNEFEKSGLTMLPSERVAPFRVAESPVQMECVVEQIIPYHNLGQISGHLIICRVVLLHLHEDILNTQGNRIDPQKIDLIGRMGRFFYARANGASVFEITQSTNTNVLGFDGLPPTLRNSPILTGQELSFFANMPVLPDLSEATAWAATQDLSDSKTLLQWHELVRVALEAGDQTRAAYLAVLGGE